jgi:hypothetical protein
MKSFLEGRPVVSRGGSPAESSTSQLPSFGSSSPDSTLATLPAYSATRDRAHAEKKIETVAVDGVIQKIVVTCGCGEKIEVHCGY